MRDMTMGVDLSDVMTRLVVVDEGGQVRSRGDVAPAPSASVIRDTARRAIADAGGNIAGCAIALAASGEQGPKDVAAALVEAGAGRARADVTSIAAGTAAALAEQWCGAARGFKQVLTFSIAEHVTAGLLLNGEPWHGAHGFASSVGWLAMNPVEREDYRRLGGLEAEVGAAGIVRRFVWRIKSGDESAVVDHAGGDFSKITVGDILNGARSGDGVSISVVRDTAKYIGMAVANLATAFDPEVVVLGGAIAQSGDLLFDSIRAECARRLRPQQAELVQVVLSTLGHDAVAIGAARAAARVGA
jgi:predicted NBD/HSP70 family sugar kinase